jgi:hypothetical protein
MSWRVDLERDGRSPGVHHHHFCMHLSLALYTQRRRNLLSISNLNGEMAELVMAPG